MVIYHQPCYICINVRIYICEQWGVTGNKVIITTKNRLNIECRYDTSLSSYLWDFKLKNNEIPSLQWSIAKFAPGYTNISKRCNLCLNEKLLILTYENQDELLNKQSELMCKFCHENKFLLSNYKSNV